MAITISDEFKAGTAKGILANAKEIEYDPSETGTSAATTVTAAINNLKVAIEESNIVSGGDQTKDELSFVDEEDNCIAQFKGGEIKTMNFDSASAATKNYVNTKVFVEIETATEEILSRTIEGDGGDDDSEALSFVDENGDCILKTSKGHIKTKYFDSREVPTKDEVKEEVQNVIGDIDFVPSDDMDTHDDRLSIVDESGECIVQFANGHIKTKNFDSRNIDVDTNYPKIIIPERITAVVGDTLQIFFKSIINAPNVEDYGIVAVCPKGKSYPRYFEYNPVANDIPDNETHKDYVLTINVYDNNAKIIVTKNCTIHVVPALKNLTGNKNILVVGASTFASGAIVKELDRRFSSTSGWCILTSASNITIDEGDTYTIDNITVTVKKIKSKKVFIVSSDDAKTLPSSGILTRLTGSGATNITYTTKTDFPYSPIGLGITGINFIGRKEAADIHQEATGGYSWKVYATDALVAPRFYVTIHSSDFISLDATYYIDGVTETQSYYFKVVEVNVQEGSGNILCEVYGGHIYSSLPANGKLIKMSGTGADEIIYSSYIFEDGNPFWYNDAIDFRHYASAYCNNANIDVLYAHLGLNGIHSKVQVDTTIENYAKPFIDAYHRDYPNGKFILGTLQMPAPYGGFGETLGAASTQDWYFRSDLFWYILEKYQELASSSAYSSFVSITECTSEFDCEGAYPVRNKEVDNRTLETEIVQTDRIHPTEDGKKMISDSIYRELTRLFN